MSTAARKARKRAGIKFEKAPKVATPPQQRSYVLFPVPGADSTKFGGSWRTRSSKKVQQYLDRFSATSVENA